MNDNKPKELAKKIQAMLIELGYEDFKLGHAYELISRINGFKNWKVANAMQTDLTQGVYERCELHSTEELVVVNGIRGLLVKRFKHSTVLFQPDNGPCGAYVMVPKERRNISSVCR